MSGKNRVRNIRAKHSVGFYSVEVVADIEATSMTCIIPENVDIYQNGELIHTDWFRLIGYEDLDEIVERVHTDAEEIANRLNESHTYVDRFGVVNFFNAVE